MYKCCSCLKQFDDWNDLETHPCPIADLLQATEPSVPNDLSDVLEDDYSELSFPDPVVNLDYYDNR